MKLGDYVNIKTGKLDANASSEDGQYPFFTCSVVPLKIDTYSYDCECVLVAGNGDLNVKYYKGKFDAYQRTYIIESKNEEILWVPYLYCFLDKYVETLRKQAIGGVIKYIKLGNLTEARINIPTIEEQKSVVSILNKVNNLIIRRKEQLEKLDELVKARFVELFDREENSKIYKLNDVCEEITAGGDRPKDTSEIKTEEYPYPVFANAATNEGLLCFSREFKVEKPCVTIAARGCTVGFTAIRCEKFTPVVRLITLVPNETVTPIYLKHYIDIKMNIEGNGAAQPQLTIPMIKSMEIMVPPIELQNQFAVFVEQTDKSKLEVQKSLEKLELLKKALMQKYFG